MQIGFWSNVHGQTSTTSNAIGIASSIGLRYGLKTLITHSHFEKSTLESSLLERSYLNTELTQLKDTGIDAFSRFMRFNTGDKETITSYTTSLLHNRFDLLMGTKNTNKELYLSDFNSTIDKILISARDYYDLVIIDVEAGKNQLSNKILNNSDIIIVNLNQNLFVLDDFFDNYYEGIEKKCYFLISLYNRESAYNIKNIKRRYKIRENIGTILYSRAYADSLNEGKALDFFYKNIKSNMKDPHYEFINELNKGADQILLDLGIDIKNKLLGD